MASSKSITKDERTQLGKIIDERFRVLGAQVAQRESEAEVVIRQRIAAEYSDEMKKIKQKLESLQQRADAIGQEYRTAVDDAVRAGFVIGKYTQREAQTPNYSGLELNIADIDRRVHSELIAMRAAGGAHKMSLHEQHLKIKENLLLSSLETDAAKEFLASIPTVDDLMPLPPNIMKEIEEVNSGS